jgi:peptidoglycan/xylan/chitin deacetylase (PgdA/CDA1 family)
MAEPMRKGETVRRALLLETGILAGAALTARRRPSAGLVLAGAGALAAWGAFARNSPLYGRVLHRGPRAADRIALTFDDGPGPSTAAVLDALRDAGARATFFVLGRQAAEHPDLVRRIANEGHELASHGYDHGILVFRGPAHVADQLRRTEQAIAAAAGSHALSRLFRAPHGFRGPATALAVTRAGYRVAGWTTGVFDADEPGADVIAARVARDLAPGSIILLHDADGWRPEASRHQTADALPAICATARARGLQPVTLSELVA